MPKYRSRLLVAMLPHAWHTLFVGLDFQSPSASEGFRRNPRWRSGSDFFRHSCFVIRHYADNSAARQLYNKEVISFAALCDDNPTWKPTPVGYGRWGCQMTDIAISENTGGPMDTARSIFHAGHDLGYRHGLLEGLRLHFKARFGLEGRRVASEARFLEDPASLREFARLTWSMRSLKKIRECLDQMFQREQNSLRKST